MAMPPEPAPPPDATDNPGGDRAISHGCTCAVLDNEHGKGYRGNPAQFSITVGCPLHDPDGVNEETPTWMQ